MFRFLKPYFADTAQARIFNQNHNLKPLQKKKGQPQLRGWPKRIKIRLS